MTLVILAMLFSQYADVYVPHSPLGAESGSLVGTFSGEIDVTYRFLETSEGITFPAVTGVVFSPDGFNQIGLELPWVRYKQDTLSHLTVGNMGAYYKRRIIGSTKWGYLAAWADAELATAQDTLGIKEAVGGNRSSYGLGIAYTYEYPVLSDYHMTFGRLPVIATAALSDRFLFRDHDAKDWSTGSELSWGLSLEVFPFDYLYLGAAVSGQEEVSVMPYAGFRWYWAELGVTWSTTQNLGLALKIYL